MGLDRITEFHLQPRPGMATQAVGGGGGDAEYLGRLVAGEAPTSRLISPSR